MQKVFATILTFAMFLIACTIMSSAAYTNDYYSIDVPDNYTLEETAQGNTWSKSDGSAVFIGVEKNAAGFDYSDLSEFEMQTLDAQIQTVYDRLGLDSVSEVKSENTTFNGYGCYSYEIDFSAYGADYRVYGNIVATDEIGYTIEISAPIIAGRAEADSILSTITFNTDADVTVKNDVAETTENVVTSEDGIISFKIPSSYISKPVPDNAMGELWTSTDSPLIGIGYKILDNTDKASLVGLSEKELDDFLSSFISGEEEMFNDPVAEACVLAGFEGVKVTATVTALGGDCFSTLYAFTTEDKIILLYCYEYEKGADERIKDILSTLTIEGTPYENNGLGIDFGKALISGLCCAVAAVIIGLVSGRRKRKKQAPAPEFPNFNPAMNVQPDDANEANPYANAVISDSEKGE